MRTSTKLTTMTTLTAAYKHKTTLNISNKSKLAKERQELLVILRETTAILEEAVKVLRGEKIE